MFLIDKQIKEHAEALISPFDPERAFNIGYDLTVDKLFNTPGEALDRIELHPSETVFVMSKEAISLPKDIAAQVFLRNKHVRQGLTLCAPFYQPGHHTRVYFRITNISSKTITLRTGDGLASIHFLQLPEEVSKPYDGTFQDEVDYSGMGDYASELRRNMSEVDEKIDSVKHIEKTVYANVLSIMAIFVGIFSLININTGSAISALDLKALLTLNLATVGSIGFLIAIINSVLNVSKSKCIAWIASIAAFAAAIILQFIK